uniref:Guanylate cyclase n=1 Tax=Sparus aurata TaxID=8175 RepID=A0A671VPM3_SPAAU
MTQDLNFTLTANYNGFNTTLYNRQGCGSSTCEGNDGEIGCVMLGPSCTYATYQLVDGLTLSIPIISAGSFGLSCDYQPKVTRILPPARKISDLLFHFIHEELLFKPAWEKTYVYKKPHINVSEDCFWYINGLEAASANFAKNGKREMLRTEKALTNALVDKKRHSNIFIICGSPDEIISIKNTVNKEKKVEIPEEIVFILIDVYNPDYYINTTSTEGMENVLVITLPQRNYTSGSNSTYNDTINDYVAGYHDGALLFGKVLRERMLARQRGSADVPLSDNPFGNASFYGAYDHIFFSHFASVSLQYEILAVFDTSQNETIFESKNQSLTWTGNKLPSDVPKKSDGKTHIHTNGVKAMWTALCSFTVAWRLLTPYSTVSVWSVSLVLGRTASQNTFFLCLLRIDYYNLTKFYGTVKFEYAVFGVFELCQRGSLRHILSDKISYPDETFMDTEFKISVMYDIAKGMSYLHSSNIQVHGRLKSTNCVVDNRMVVKITDFGCHTILNPGRDLWTAPEHLREDGVSQKGDVYSYAIIAHEIIHRRSPFYTQFCSNPTEKLYRVQFPMGMGYFRPDLNFDGASAREVELYMLIKNCWDEDPERRPDFKRIELSLGKIFSNLHNQATETYMDNLIRRLQMYSRTLEHLVEERTSLYKAERDRADRLNFMLLPGPVVRSLKETGKVKPELFEEVTIYFSDIVGFTTLCHYSTPMEVVDMLNDIYKNFDNILDHHDVYKVETIGDAYMVASGLPKRNGDRHAVDIALMALDMLAFVGSFELLHLPGIPLWIRIGVHSGPCAAGVVGNKMPRYCLFGDTVNTASRMESTGLPLRIHVSQSTINILQRTDCQFEYEQRGETYLKGKGKEMTYWLTGIMGGKYNLPTPPTAENFQRLQQDLAEMIVSSLEKREDRRFKKTLSTKVLRRETDSSLQGDSSPEYFHLAVTDNPSTFL